MIKVYSNENVILVNNIKNLLANSGISAYVKNENMLSYGVGAGSISWPELWLHDSEQEQKAIELIKFNSENEMLNQEKWECISCSEMNEAQFNICWKCNQSKTN